MSDVSKNGLVSALFDFSFSSFISTKIVKLLYGLGILAIAITALVLVIGAFGEGVGTGLGMLLVLGPLGAVLALLYLRVSMELLIVLFRIAENLQSIADEVAEADLA